MSNLANERFFPAEPDWVFAALGYGRAHARSTLSIAFREFSSEI